MPYFTQENGEPSINDSIIIVVPDQVLEETKQLQQGLRGPMALLTISGVLR